MRLVFPCLLATVLSLTLTVGCDKEKAPSKSPAAYFRETQKETSTTHGKIRIETVVDAEDSTILYQTEDGRTWRVTATSDGRGGYRYDQLQAVQ
jgi:hypothetical protein